MYVYTYLRVFIFGEKHRKIRHWHCSCIITLQCSLPYNDDDDDNGVDNMGSQNSKHYMPAWDTSSEAQRDSRGILVCPASIFVDKIGSSAIEMKGQGDDQCRFMTTMYWKDSGGLILRNMLVHLRYSSTAASVHHRHEHPRPRVTFEPSLPSLKRDKHIWENFRRL